MVESINTKVELIADATSYLGAGTYGQIMIGDKGFEFYNKRNVNDFIQVPWDEVDQVVASVMFGGKRIPRFAIQSKTNGTFSFAAKDPKKVLRAIREHVDPAHMVRSLTFMDVVKRGVKRIFVHSDK